MRITGYPIDFIILDSELHKIGVDPRSIPLFHNKSFIWMYKIVQIDSRAAMILKQLFLSSGGDVAVNWEVIRFTCEKTDAIIIGTVKHYLEVLKKLQSQPFFGLDIIANELELFIQSKQQIRTMPKIMGILNITPDSFSDGGKFLKMEEALRHSETLVSDGAELLDIGGESSRPGSEQVSEEIEMERVLPVVKELKKNFPAVQLSVDTTKPRVAEKAIELGVNIINCIQMNSDMMKVLADSSVHCVLMHMRGTPKDMQQLTIYPEGIIQEINQFFETKLKEIESHSIDPARVWLDPGIGFAKTPEQNISILHHLDSFLFWKLPLLVGHSKKSFMNAIYHLSVDNRQVCTALYSYIALLKGVSILRVHDVAETKLALQIYQNQLNET